MTFIISSDGVNNTVGTTAKFGSRGFVKVGGNFKNSGKVEIDIRASLEILGSIDNFGDFSIKDYVNERFCVLLESAINSLNGDAKEYLKLSYRSLKDQNIKNADSYFKKFVGYISEHPELLTSSVQIFLQAFQISR